MNSKICIRCHKTFYRKCGRSKNEFMKQKLCSMACVYDNMRDGAIIMSGTNHAQWKGGIKYTRGYKYVYQPNHPTAKQDRYIAEHRLVMEHYLGRFLIKGEYIHHINGDKLDNRIENLFLCRNQSEHEDIHRQMRSLLYELVNSKIVIFDIDKKEYLIVR